MIKLVSGCMASGMVLSLPASSVQSAVPRNAHQWRAIGDFLDTQWLASLGLRRLSSAESEARRGPACGVGPRVSAPDGNHGDNTLKLSV